MARKARVEFAFLAGLLLVALALVGCATNPPAYHVKGRPQPERWKMFLQKAEQGEIAEVPDEAAAVEDANTLGLMTLRRGKAHPAAAAQARSGAAWAKAVAGGTRRGFQEYAMKARALIGKGEGEQAVAIVDSWELNVAVAALSHPP
jgi:hypothetical protein